MKIDIRRKKTLPLLIILNVGVHGPALATVNDAAAAASWRKTKRLTRRRWLFGQSGRQRRRWWKWTTGKSWMALAGCHAAESAGTWSGNVFGRISDHCCLGRDREADLWQRRMMWSCGVQGWICCWRMLRMIRRPRPGAACGIFPLAPTGSPLCAVSGDPSPRHPGTSILASMAEKKVENNTSKVTSV